MIIRSNSSNCLTHAEFYVYFIIWTGAVFYSIYCFASNSNKYFQHYNDTYADFSEGWTWLLPRNRHRLDTADYEWQTLKYLVHKLYLWMAALIVGGELLRQHQLITVLKLYQVIISIAFILLELGLHSLFIILLQPVAFFLLGFIISSNNRGSTTTNISIWCLNGISLVLLTIYKNFIVVSSSSNATNDETDERKFYIVVLTIFWMNLKCTHYILDIVTSFNQIKITPMSFNCWLNFISYVLYLPTLLCGPFMTRDSFEGSYCSVRSRDYMFMERMRRFVGDCMRALFWLIFAEFALHFVPVNATAFQPHLVESFDSWSLYGYGYAMGQFFHIKYIVLYGLSTAVAKFDRINTPTLPKCIGRIHLYSDMWKWFDAGLYTFLLRHIYVPTIKHFYHHHHRVAAGKFLASFLCFAFVYVWHGTDHYILVWVTLNFVGVIVESVVVKEMAMKWLWWWWRSDDGEKSCGGTKWWMVKPQYRGQRILTCLLCSPLLAMSAISNFYFFARSTIGAIFVRRIFLDSFTSNVVLFVILYCCCQVSSEFKLWEQQVTENRDNIMATVKNKKSSK